MKKVGAVWGCDYKGSKRANRKHLDSKPENRSKMGRPGLDEWKTSRIFYESRKRRYGGKKAK
jgi:hypothetical protein